MTAVILLIVSFTGGKKKKTNARGLNGEILHEADCTQTGGTFVKAPFESSNSFPIDWGQFMMQANQLVSANCDVFAFEFIKNRISG